MKEQEARNQGLNFTGHYSHDKEKIKANAAAIRKLGYKAVVVSIPPNPLSRGHSGMGYSVYAEPRFRNDEDAKRLQQSVCSHPARLAAIRAEYEAKMTAALEEENKRNDCHVKWLTENNYALTTYAADAVAIVVVEAARKVSANLKILTEDDVLGRVANFAPLLVDALRSYAGCDKNAEAEKMAELLEVLATFKSGKAKRP